VVNEQTSYRVGVLFGGRSSEHEVSLASARNVMEALRQAGHQVVPIGITPQGRWLPRPNALALLTGDVADAPPSCDAGWGLLPHSAPDEPLPAIDVIFPVLHGPYGEDGTVQGLLEMANLPYVGSGVLASACAMDKAIARRLFAEAGAAADALPGGDAPRVAADAGQCRGSAGGRAELSDVRQAGQHGQQRRREQSA
jgi:D-alanine-D-alanine ligase